MTPAKVSLTVGVPGVTAVGTTAVYGTISVSNFPAFPNSFAISNFPSFPALQAVSGTLAISNFPGSFAVSNFPAPPAVQAVSGVFWPAVQPVSGFPAIQPVSGTFWQANQPVTVTNQPAIATYARKLTTGVTTVKLGPGRLDKIIFGMQGATNPVTITVADGLVPIASLRYSNSGNANPVVTEFDCAFVTSLIVTASGATDLTIIYV